MQNFLNLWPSYMSFSQFDGDVSAIKELVLNEHSNNAPTLESTTTVNGTQVNPSVDPWNWKHEEWSPVKKFIQDSLKEYSTTVYPFAESAIPEVKRSWTLVYDEEGYQQPHCHPQMDLSLLFVLQSSSSGGEIVFTNPALQSSYTNYQPYSQTFQLTAGDLLIWPAWFLHYTLPTKGPLQKIVVSFDARLYE